MHKTSLDAYAQIMNGCSGGLSRFYKKFFDKDISCRYCCDEHDMAYYEGGSSADRKLADRRLQKCAAQAGRSGGSLGKAWRWLRSWIIYLAVRVAGGYFWTRR